MGKEENILIKSIRDYLYKSGCDEVDANKIAEELKVPLKDILSIAKTPQELVSKVFNHELTELASILNEYNFEQQNAIDTFIIIGQEVFKRFHDVNPVITYHLKQNFPQQYEEHLQNKLFFLKKLVIDNLKRGQSQGIYKKDINLELLNKKVEDKVSKIHGHDLLSTGKLTFDIIFNDLIEEFIKEVSEEDGWKYYVNRKHLVEALDFNR
ncbi:MAG: hypothetical protein GXO47_05965 [Chlorobi bacterium]|nr:hypothetical protein [Chlorobiota bacterium]